MAHPRRADMFVGVLYVTVRAGPPRQNEHARPQGLWRLQDPGADGQPGFSATSERDNMRGGRFVIAYLYMSTNEKYIGLDHTWWKALGRSRPIARPKTSDHASF